MTTPFWGLYEDLPPPSTGAPSVPSSPVPPTTPNTPSSTDTTSGDVFEGFLKELMFTLQNGLQGKI